MEPAEDVEANHLDGDDRRSSKSVSRPADIDLTFVSKENSLDSVDMPLTPRRHMSLIPENFSRLMTDRGGFSRRSSNRSSTTSIDTVNSKVMGDKERLVSEHSDVDKSTPMREWTSQLSETPNFRLCLNARRRWSPSFVTWLSPTRR